jgi:hypothetical protein
MRNSEVMAGRKSSRGEHLTFKLVDLRLEKVQKAEVKFRSQTLQYDERRTRTILRIPSKPGKGSPRYPLGGK